MNWRELGDLPKDVMVAKMREYDSPMLDEADVVYAALKGHTVLGTAILYHEKKFDTYNQVIPQHFHNPFAWSSGWANGAHTWHNFPDYQTAAKKWLAWLLSADSPFKSARTVAEFVHIYAPSSDGNDEGRYVNIIEGYARDYGTGGSTPVPDTNLVFGNCRPPDYITAIIQKPWVGAGYDPVPPRNNVGMCMHKWWGFGDEYSITRLMSTGGERQADAMVDWSITQEGVVTLTNEPWKTRAGWANGPANHLEGDGVLFVRTLGVGAVNSRLVSCEFEGKDEPLTEDQMEKGSSLWAYYYDAWKVPWDVYPMHPAYNIVTDLDHWEIGDKECPFKGARSQRSHFQDMVRGKLKAGQVAGSSDPIPPPNPPAPDHDWLPDGLTEDQVEILFGTLTRHRPDGSTVEVGFDAQGVISNAWLGRGQKDKAFPEARDWWEMVDAEGVIRHVVSFANGWLLFGSTGRDSWRWM